MTNNTIYYLNYKGCLFVLFGVDNMQYLKQFLNGMLKNGECATIQKGSNKPFLRVINNNNKINLSIIK